MKHTHTYALVIVPNKHNLKEMFSLQARCVYHLQRTVEHDALLMGFIYEHVYI